MHFQFLPILDKIIELYETPRNMERFQALNLFFQQNKDTEDYPLIFTFLYGDEAAISLGYSSLGVQTAMAGFHYAANKS
ncbi:MAG: hypothetical protein ACKVTZ_01860 [Bacteroidia bacterium]